MDLESKSKWNITLSFIKHCYNLFNHRGDRYPGTRRAGWVGGMRLRVVPTRRGGEASLRIPLRSVPYCKHLVAVPLRVGGSNEAPIITLVG